MICRPLEEIESDWKKDKEDLIQEFKKKRRDVSLCYLVLL